MLDVLRYLGRRLTYRVADLLVTAPLIRWTWPGTGSQDHNAALVEFRPTDRETILEMMDGRYLLASKLIDTGGASPFDVDTEHVEWSDSLRSFSWLRHFRDARNATERSFARQLTLDWIAREGRFDARTWTLDLTARRVMNWLRHYPLLVEGAARDEMSRINKALGTQVQSLRVRGAIAAEPTDALMAAIALCGVALCDTALEAEIAPRLRDVLHLLDAQVDGDGMHLSRSPKVQLMLMVELVTILKALQRDEPDLADRLTRRVERMHEALDAVTLGTGEPGYFHGSGQLPHDIIVAVQVQSVARRRHSGAASGYGILIDGDSVVVADGGVIPALDFARDAHASALAFEFSHGRDLIVGSCGPAPHEFFGTETLFRRGIAHSAPTINAASAAQIFERGPLAGRVRALAPALPVEAVPDDQLLVLRTDGFRERFGVRLERRLTLMAGGTTLVGQDRIVGARRASGVCSVRFHLAPGTTVSAGPQDDLLRLRLNSGARWTFMWEGAEMRQEESIRQSAHFDYHRTRQIVLEAEVVEGREIAWILTRDEG